MLIGGFHWVTNYHSIFTLELYLEVGTELDYLEK